MTLGLLRLCQMAYQKVSRIETALSYFLVGHLALPQLPSFCPPVD
jgi:hypothetical protein